jgi:exonuclease SbcC
MEDETLAVRLDAEFTPVIIQDGYETAIEHLSGGEKTSVALAYRLALNKAVNDFLTAINTRDLLILDEPTDGFSSEQLDRVREVLDQLRLRQVIIVSHEAQMEGYVDHVLRVQKQGHESRVAA